MIWLVLVTSCLCYNLDLVEKMPKLNLTNSGYSAIYISSKLSFLLLKSIKEAYTILGDQL